MSRLYDEIAFPAGTPMKFSILDVEEYPFHMHRDVLEIIFMLEGALELTVVNNVLQMAEGDIYICSPNELHRLRASGGPGIAMLIYIDLGAYKADFPDIETYQFANSALENNRTGIQMLGNYLKKHIPMLLDRWEAAWNDVKEVGERILRILIQEFQCYYIGKFYPEFNDIYKGNEVQLRRIRRIVDHIYRNCSKPLMIKDVADMEHISTYHLTYILKNGCGMGFRMFLNMARAEQSAAKLLEGEKGLQTIGYECGFSKYQYFSDCFKKVFRMTPQQYRQKYRDCTIAVRPGAVRELEGAELEGLIRKFCSRSEEIGLDLALEHPFRRFRAPVCVNLPGARYDHITGLPALRRLKEELSFDLVGVDMAFLRRYKGSPRALGYILSDFWSLRAGVRFCLTGGDSPQEVRGLLEFLKALPAGAGGAVEFTVAPGEEAEALERLLSAGGYPAQEAPPPMEPECNPIHSSGYMPCYLLQAMAQGAPWRLDQIALSDEPGPGGCGGLALMTETGLKKPVYHLLWLLERMGDALVEQGDMYFITRTSGTEDFQVMVYYYDACFDALFQDPSKAAEHAIFIDMVARDSDSSREITLRIDHLPGNYALRRYRLTAEDYLAKYGDAPFLAGGAPSAETLRVLNATLAPEATLSMLEAAGTFRMDFKLTPFEIVLFSFEKL